MERLERHRRMLFTRRDVCAAELPAEDEGTSNHMTGRAQRDPRQHT